MNQNISQLTDLTLTSPSNSHKMCAKGYSIDMIRTLQCPTLNVRCTENTGDRIKGLPGRMGHVVPKESEKPQPPRHEMTPYC